MFIVQCYEVASISSVSGLLSVVIVTGHQQQCSPQCSLTSQEMPIVLENCYLFCSWNIHEDQIPIFQVKKLRQFKQCKKKISVSWFPALCFCYRTAFPPLMACFKYSLFSLSKYWFCSPAFKKTRANLALFGCFSVCESLENSIY